MHTKRHSLDLHYPSRSFDFFTWVTVVWFFTFVALALQAWFLLIISGYALIKLLLIPYKSYRVAVTLPLFTQSTKERTVWFYTCPKCKIRTRPFLIVNYHRDAQFVKCPECDNEWELE